MNIRSRTMIAAIFTGLLVMNTTRLDAVESELNRWQFQYTEIDNKLQVTSEEIISVDLPFFWLTTKHLDADGNIYLHGSHEDRSYVVKLSPQLKILWSIHVPLGSNYYRASIDNKNILKISDESKLVSVELESGSIVDVNEFTEGKERHFFGKDGHQLKIKQNDSGDGVLIDGVIYYGDINPDKIVYMNEDDNGYWLIETYEKHFNGWFDSENAHVFIMRMSRLSKAGKIISQNELGQYDSEFSFVKIGSQGRTYGPYSTIQLFSFDYYGSGDIYGMPLVDESGFYILIRTLYDGLTKDRYNLYHFDPQGKLIWKKEFPKSDGFTHQIYNQVQLIRFEVDGSLLMADESSVRILMLFDRKGKLIKDEIVSDSLKSNYSLVIKKSEERVRLLRIDR